MEAKNFKRLIFVPGWMDKAELHGYGNGLDIWMQEADSAEKINAEFILGHSLGAAFALLVWQANQGVKVILVNPLIPKRSVFFWFLRWINFLIFEGIQMPFGRIAVFTHFFSGTKKCLKLLDLDPLEILDQIPRNKLVVIRGKEDHYFCDRAVAKMIRSKNIRLVEVEKTGHGWNGKIDEAVTEILNEKQKLA